jgi:hypothetical protein
VAPSPGRTRIVLLVIRCGSREGGDERDTGCAPDQK